MTRRILAPIIGIITFLALWEGFVRVMHVRRFILRAPSTALRHLWNFRSNYVSGGWVTIQHAAKAGTKAMPQRRRSAHAVRLANAGKTAR